MGHGPKGHGTRYLLPELIDRGVTESFTGLTYRGFTAYVFTGRIESLDSTVDLIRQSCLDPVMDPEAIAVERGRSVGARWSPGVVEDEFRLRRSWPREAVSAVTSALHPGDVLSHDQSGQPDLLRLLTDEAVRAFHRDWYSTVSIVTCRAVEGKPFEVIDNGGDPSWAWQPQIRHAVLPIGQAEDTRFGPPPNAYVIGWRVGAFPSRRRRHSLLVARCLSVALGLPDLRHRLATSGWSVLVGPIVDPTLPDPCVIVVVRAPVGVFDAATVGNTVNGLLRSVIHDQPDLTRLRALAERMREPLVAEPWAARAILALADALAADLSDLPEPSFEELREALLRCTDGQPGEHVGGEPVILAVKPPPAPGSPPKAFPVIESVAAPRRSADDIFRRGSTEVSDRQDLDPFELVVGADNRCWPNADMAASVVIYPSARVARHVRLAALVEWWPTGSAGSRLPPPRLWVSGTAGGPRPFVEWSLKSGKGQLRHAFTSLANAMDAVREPMSPGRHPFEPDPFLVAASLSGSAEASAVLAMHGYTIADHHSPDGAAPAPEAGNIISVSVTGSGVDSIGDDLWAAARNAARTIFARVALLPTQASHHLLSSIDVYRDESGHWWLRDCPPRDGRPPLTAYAVQPLQADHKMITIVRRAMRDMGYYAVEGRIVEDWGVAVFTVHCPSVDRLVGDRLAKVVAMASSHSSDGSYGAEPFPQVCPPAATPQAATAALQRRLGEPLLRSPSISPVDQASRARPTILLATTDHQLG